MAVAACRFKKGPCDGKYGVVDVTNGPPKTTTCGGHTYKLTNAKSDPLVYTDAGKTPSPGGPGPTGIAPETLKGWDALRKSVNTTMPNALREARQMRQQALRDLARVRKVHK